MKNNEDSLSNKIDSLHQEIVQLRTEVEKRNNQAKDSTTLGRSITPPVLEQSPPKEKQTITVKTSPTDTKQSVVIQNTTSEDVKYYNGLPKRISVIIGAWKENKRRITFFSPGGIETYSIEDVRHSYSSVSEIVAYHDNGAVAKVKTHTNPGASMYWYDAITTFDTDNTPLWKISTQYPQRSVSLNTDDTYYWHVERKEWIKQTQVKEQPYVD
jgi:hypothetical protein